MATTQRSGVFLTFEGGEGAGKTTAIAAASHKLEALGIKHRVTREPGGCQLGNALRQIVLDPAHAGMCAQSEALLMFAARAQHIVETIRPALAAGEWVISDRYTDASFAYQGGGRGLPREMLISLERWATFDLKPDCTILLDVAVDEGLRRVAQRGASDRMERESVAFFERVRAAYLQRAAEEPARFRVIAAHRAADRVAADVEGVLDQLAEAWRAR